MPPVVRPLSPHLQVYRWQIQMVTSILHRATGVFLAGGTLLFVAGLLALASGPESWACVSDFAGSWIGLLLMLGWTWSLSYHLLNGIRHLLQDAGMGYAITQFVRNGWLTVVGSLVITVLLWAWLLTRGGVA